MLAVVALFAACCGNSAKKATAAAESVEATEVVCECACDSCACEPCACAEKCAEGCDSCKCEKEACCSEAQACEGACAAETAAE